MSGLVQALEDGARDVPELPELVLAEDVHHPPAHVAGVFGSGCGDGVEAFRRVDDLDGNQQRLDATRGAFPDALERITAVVGDVSTLAGAEELAEAVAEAVGQVDHVVIGLNAWMQGEPFWEVSEDAWQRVLDITTSYFAAARALAPHIRTGGSLTMIHGLAFHVALPLASPITIYGGALRAMVPAFTRDLGGRVRVNSVAFAQVASPSRGGNVSPDWVTDEQAGRVMTAVATSDVTAFELLVPDLRTYHSVAEGDFGPALNPAFCPLPTTTHPDPERRQS